MILARLDLIIDVRANILTCAPLYDYIDVGICPIRCHDTNTCKSPADTSSISLSRCLRLSLSLSLPLERAARSAVRSSREPRRATEISANAGTIYYYYYYYYY